MQGLQLELAIASTSRSFDLGIVMINTQTNSPSSAPTISPPTEKSPLSVRTNDDSNPQQGSGPAMAEQQSAGTGGSSGGGGSGGIGGPPLPDDVANKGSGSRMGPMKSPPTKFDSRKLFVGGLPPDGTY